MEILACPKCKGSIKINEKNLVCIECNQQYPIDGKIGVLVPNFTEHQRLIEKKMKGDQQDWYISDQIISYDEGPYRHHVKKRISFVESVIESFIKKNSKLKNILDLGCGDGANLRWLSKYTKNLWATDYNLARLTKTRSLIEKLNIQARLYLADIMSLPFADSSFDLIFFNHVIEHIPNDLLVLQNIYRILAKKGIVILGTPNEGSLSWRFAYAIEPKIKKETDHVNFYTSKSLSNLARRAGFKIKQVEFIGWGIPIWRLDPLLRKYKFLDDLFETLGKKFVKNQATSLYIILEK